MLARDLAKAERATVYGRIGTCTQEYGTITSWLVDVLNVLTGNLDRVGGALFPMAAAGARNTTGVPGKGRGMRLGEKKSRVRGAPQVAGELPVAVLAEEITTPGAGQIRALITIAGNPALSTPESERLDAALDTLEFMVSVDGYLNETTRHAHVILPPPSPLQRSHYDLAFYQLSARNIAHYSHPIFSLESNQQEEWKTLLRLTGVVAGQGASADVTALDDFVAYQVVSREVGMAESRVEGRDANELLVALQLRRGPERLLDFLLRVGPYGDAFGAQPDGLTLAAIEDNHNGLDLGPLQPRIPEVLRTPSGKVELAPEPIVADLGRMRQSMSRPVPAMVLIGRRELRSNNSWMHNVPALMKGEDPCTLLLHPDDAARLGLAGGDRAQITSSASSVEAPVQITPDIMPGVVSLPHGWGHDQPGTRLRVANERHGVNINRLMSNLAIDPLSGNATLNAIPVEITLARRSEPAAPIPVAD
jgi:anaerobic selenocysteine-containing dehydrogenase